MIQNLGNYPAGATVYFLWNTNGADGASITRSTNGSIRVYKNNGTTEDSDGITDTEDFDGLTGVHACTIDTSADGTFYSDGGDFTVVLAGAVIDTKTVNAAIARFTLGKETTDVRKFGGTAGTFSGGRPEVNTTHWGGTAVASAIVPANMVQISGDATAADNLETAADGGSYNLGGGGVVAASVTGAVGSVTGNVGGTVNGLTATAQGNVRTAVGLANADLDTQLGTLDGKVDDVKAVTDDVAQLLEDDGGTPRFTANALEEAPTGVGGGTDWTADERTAIRAILGIPGSGTTPADPSTGILDTIRDAVGGLNDLSSSDVQTAAAAALTTYDPPTKTEMDSAIGAIPAAPSTAQNADALLARSIAGGADGGRSVKDALKSLRNKTEIAAGTLTVYEADDTTPAWTAAVTTAAGDPLSGIDPA